MCLIRLNYKKQFLCRYDKDNITPYFSPSDFPGLIFEEKSFKNKKEA